LFPNSNSKDLNYFFAKLNLAQGAGRMAQGVRIKNSIIKQHATNNQQHTLRAKLYKKSNDY